MDDQMSAEVDVVDADGKSVFKGRMPDWKKMEVSGFGRVKEVSVTLSFTKNMGNYQSLKAETGMVCQVEDSSKVQDIMTGMWRECSTQIKHTIEESITGLKG